jgi:hypothetical protein
MNYDYQQSNLSRSVLGGLFAGIAAAAANLIFVFIYRAITQFYDFNGIDVTVIVFGSIFLSIACGVIFYLFVHYLNKGLQVYRLMVVIVTFAIIYFGLALRRTLVGEVPGDFRALVIGTQIVIGSLAEFLIPYLFRHDSLIS